MTLEFPLKKGDFKKLTSYKFLKTTKEIQN